MSIDTSPRIRTDAADFYLGRGPSAEYLGTRTDNGGPEHIELWGRFQSLTEEPVTDDEFRDEVGELINFTRWPWTSHATSADTPWAYMFDRGTLYVYRYGVELARIVANYTVPTRDHQGRQARPAVTNQFPTVDATR